MAYPGWTIIVIVGAALSSVLFFLYERNRQQQQEQQQQQQGRQAQNDSVQLKNRGPHQSSYVPEKCSICFELTKDKLLGKLIPCGHIFCYQCILSWKGSAGRYHTCPLCRSAIQGVTKKYNSSTF